MSIPLLEGIVYGPVRSRRLGRSLGINVLPVGMKVCNMNCAYCQYGWTRSERRAPIHRSRWPTPSDVEAAVGARLQQAAAGNELIDRLTVAGHGEPTLHPQFEEIAEQLFRLRDRLAPAIRLAILSNSTTAAWPAVRSALLRFDECHMKLDAGDPLTQACINGSWAPIDETVGALRAIKGVILQSMFVTDPANRFDNTSEGAIHEWLAAVEAIEPTRVELYTLDRPPALAGLQPVTATRLKEIAERVHAMGIHAEVFVARDSRPRA